MFLPSKYFAGLQDVFKTYLRGFQCDNFLSFKMSTRRVQDVFKTCLEDVFKTTWKPTNVFWVWILGGTCSEM